VVSVVEVVVVSVPVTAVVVVLVSVAVTSEAVVVDPVAGNVVVLDISREVAVVSPV